MRQTALLHTTVHRPPLLADPWAMQNMSGLLAAADVHLPTSLRPFLHTLMARLAAVDFSALPHTLIHGDLTKGNLIAMPGNQIAVIDFGVANYLPRVQELAVAAANLMHDGYTPLLDRCEQVREAYTLHSKLTDTEHRLL